MLKLTHTRAVFLMVVVTLLWSIAGLVTRHLEQARSFEVTFWRSFFTLLSLLVMLPAIQGRGVFGTIRRGGAALWLSGLCWATMFTAFMVALTLMPVANVLVTMAVGPLLTALFARIFIGHHIALRTWVAIGLAGLGIGWMYGSQMAGLPLSGSAVLYAWNLVLQRQQALLAKPEEVAFFQALVQFGFLGIGAWWFAPFPTGAVWWLLVVSAILSAASIMLLSWAYGRAEAQVLVPLEYTAFIWAAIVGWIAFAEPVTVPMLAGVTLIVAGCLYATRKASPDVIAQK